MLNISKYHKLIVSCGAIATASVGGFVQSADAAGTHNQTAQSSPITTLIAGKDGGLNGSNAGGYNGSNAGGYNPGKGGGGQGGLNGSNNGGKGVYYYDAKGPKGPGTYYYDSNNGGAAPKGDKPGRYYYYDSNNGGSLNGSNNGGLNGSNNGGKGPGYYYYDSNNGGNGPKGPGYYYDANGPKGPGYYNYNPDVTVNPKPGPGPVVEPKPGPGPVVEPKPGPETIGKLPQNGSDGGSTNNGSNAGGNFSRPGFNPTQIARSQALSSRITIASGKYDAALAALAAAEAAQPNTSSSTSPVRYGREPGDIASCGCPNADTNSAGTPSKELVAAKAAEAEAAAELAAAKAEARQFLESVKGGSTESGSSSPIW
jgi:hypothetical protein